MPKAAPGSTTVVAVADLERELLKANCIKTAKHTGRSCIWRAPNGLHFMAPNAATMAFVPSRSLVAIRKILELLKEISP